MTCRVRSAAQGTTALQRRCHQYKQVNGQRPRSPPTRASSAAACAASTSISDTRRGGCGDTHRGDHRRAWNRAVGPGAGTGRTVPRTVWPASSDRSTMCAPANPVAPVTQMVLRVAVSTGSRAGSRSGPMVLSSRSIAVSLRCPQTCPECPPTCHHAPPLPLHSELLDERQQHRTMRSPLAQPAGRLAPFEARSTLATNCDDGERGRVVSERLRGPAAAAG